MLTATAVLSTVNMANAYFFADHNIVYCFDGPEVCDEFTCPDDYEPWQNGICDAGRAVCREEVTWWFDNFVYFTCDEIE